MVASAVGIRAALQACRLRRLRTTPVTRHHGASGDTDLADFTGLHRGPRRVEKAHIEMLAGPPDRDLLEIGNRGTWQPEISRHIGLRIRSR